jgi:hypothetical protein
MLRFDTWVIPGGRSTVLNGFRKGLVSRLYCLKRKVIHSYLVATFLETAFIPGLRNLFARHASCDLVSPKKLSTSGHE